MRHPLSLSRRPACAREDRVVEALAQRFLLLGDPVDAFEQTVEIGLACQPALAVELLA
jgi:hypothetical protein